MIESSQRRMYAILLTVIVASAAVGVVAAALLSTQQLVHTAFASHNCTRYGPNYAVNPANCSKKFTMTMGLYDTNGHAQRDSNTISMSAQRSWSLWLETLDNTFPQNDSGFGYGHAQGGASGQTYAGCTRGSSVNGQCYTRWD
jgi:hypothetical protein